MVKHAPAIYNHCFNGKNFRYSIKLVLLSLECQDFSFATFILRWNVICHQAENFSTSSKSVHYLPLTLGSESHEILSRLLVNAASRYTSASDIERTLIKRLNNKVFCIIFSTSEKGNNFVTTYP